MKKDTKKEQVEKMTAVAVVAERADRTTQHDVLISDLLNNNTLPCS